MDGEIAAGQAGLLAEWADGRDGIRHMQRERQAFLAFSIAAQGTLLGLLINNTAALTATGNFCVVALGAIAGIGAQFLTLRSTLGILTQAAYIRLFLEPQIPGINFERRVAAIPTSKRPRLTGGTFGLGVVQVGVSGVSVIAWFSIASSRTVLLSLAICLLFLVTVVLAWGLAFERPQKIWKATGTVWQPVIEKERRGLTRESRCRGDDIDDIVRLKDNYGREGTSEL